MFRLLIVSGNTVIIITIIDTSDTSLISPEIAIISPTLTSHTYAAACSIVYVAVKVNIPPTAIVEVDESAVLIQDQLNLIPHYFHS